MDGDGDAPRVVDDVDEFVLLLLLFALATVLLPPVAAVALFLFLIGEGDNERKFAARSAISFIHSSSLCKYNIQILFSVLVQPIIVFCKKLSGVFFCMYATLFTLITHTRLHNLNPPQSTNKNE